MSEFHKFATQIHNRFNKLSGHELFTVRSADNPDQLWELYLASFPEGSNPIYRERTEHDCSCCKNFVRNLGNVVAIVDGKVLNIWDVDGLEYPYNEVAAALSAHVASQAITGLYRTKEASYGAAHSIELLESGGTKKWNHFHGKVSARHLSREPDTDRGVFNTTAQVFKRGLDELTQESFDTVVDLIDGKALYRGEEFLGSIKAFQKLQRQYLSLASAKEKEVFIWANTNAPASRFRNTAIGSLIQDLSEGVEVETAVRSFESKVAPMNYKRPTALITPRMVQDAMKTIQDLGLEPSLERRFARLSDVSVNNVLWVDNSARGQMRDCIEGLLMDAAVSNKTLDTSKAVNIGIDDFMAKILPQATSMAVLVKGAHLPNFMSITAPAVEDSKKLFKWNNNFGWSYDGNITDSIKEKVKKAGGNVTNAQLRVSLAWFNLDDLDLHMHSPKGGHVYFGTRRGFGAVLDVDMNGMDGRSREPVENISFESVADGTYMVEVVQYNKRESTDPGFVIEIENQGNIQQFSYNQHVRSGDRFGVASITVKGGVIVKLDISDKLVGGEISQEKWGVSTGELVKVNTLMKSPNHWDGNEVGNKHWFFILDKCNNDAPTRGIYNEFLDSDLEKHRKVFEILGDKTKCRPTEDQLSGLGFSSTRNDTVTVSVTGNKISNTYNIQF